VRPSFHPVVVNDPFGDPVVYVDWLFERRALLLDLGRVDTLGARKLGRVTHAFVLHAHMDHFAGFDHAHLTARQAGLIARAAGVRRLYPFHFSPRSAGAGDRLAREAQEAFLGATAPQVGREHPGFRPDHVS